MIMKILSTIIYTFVLSLLIKSQQTVGDVEDDCLYLEYSGVAVGLDVCFCDREDGELSCTIWECIEEDSSYIQAIYWDGDCYSGNPTTNTTIDASIIAGSSAEVHCSNTASTDCAVKIRYYDSDTSATTCDTNEDDYSELVWIESYCYNIPSVSHSYYQQCNGNYFIYSNVDDCSGNYFSYDFTDSCDYDDDDNIYEINEVTCACGTCGSTQASSSATRNGILYLLLLLFLFLFLMVILL